MGNEANSGSFEDIPLSIMVYILCIISETAYSAWRYHAFCCSFYNFLVYISMNNHSVL